MGLEQQVRLFTQKTVQSDRQAGVVAEAFDNLRLDVHTCAGEILETPQQIVAATLACDRLAARTDG